MAGKTARTQWSKEPDEEPDYSDWKITLALKKASDDPAARPLTRSSSSKPKTKKTPSSLSVTFSVHRNILGPQSEYFNRIFKSNDDGFSEAHHQHSHIDLPSTISMKSFGVIVKAFEVFLDYCYLENVDFSFKEASPVPLLYFCDYFQMEDDFERKVEEYSKTGFNEMASEDKLHLLYEEIIDFRTAGLNVERAQTITSEICHNDMYDLLSEGTSMAEIADLPLWLNIVSLIQEKGDKNHGLAARSCSECIANFLENNDNSSAVDGYSFQKLTGEEILPYVEANAALVLLKKEQTYATLDFHICDNDYEDEDNKETESPALTDLQNRCIESLVDAQLEHNSNKELRDRAMKIMILLPRVVMGVYLNKTLKSYGEEKVMHKQQSQKFVQENAKRRKLEQDSTVQLKNVEQELKTEKEKYRLLLAERVNNRTVNTNHRPVSAQQQRIDLEFQYIQQRRYK